MALYTLQTTGAGEVGEGGLGGGRTGAGHRGGKQHGRQPQRAHRFKIGILLPVIMSRRIISTLSLCKMCLSSKNETGVYESDSSLKRERGCLHDTGATFAPARVHSDSFS